MLLVAAAFTAWLGPLSAVIVVSAAAIVAAVLEAGHDASASARAAIAAYAEALVDDLEPLKETASECLNNLNEMKHEIEEFRSMVYRHWNPPDE